MLKEVILPWLACMAIIVVTAGAAVGVAAELGRPELAVSLAIALGSVAVASIWGGALSGHRTPYW